MNTGAAPEIIEEFDICLEMPAHEHRRVARMRAWRASLNPPRRVWSLGKADRSC